STPGAGCAGPAMAWPRTPPNEAPSAGAARDDDEPPPTAKPPPPCAPDVPRTTFDMLGLCDQIFRVGAQDDPAFLLEPLGDSDDFLLRSLDFGNAHRPLGLDLFVEGFGGALRHVARDLLAQRRVDALERRHQKRLVDLLEQRADAAIVDFEQIVEDEHVVVDAL